MFFFAWERDRWWWCLFWGDFQTKTEKLFLVCVDLEKAFDHVPKEVICFALFCRWIMSVKGGVHWVCLESTFIYHVNGCSGRRCERWFINRVVLCRESCFSGESLNKVMDKYGRWKNAVERKSLRVNVDKKGYDKKIVLRRWFFVSLVSGLVGCNSIYCAKCQSWVHCRCSDVPRQQVSLLSCWDVFACRTCLGYHCSVEEKWSFLNFTSLLLNNDDQDEGSGNFLLSG